jgi:hypothetical protein
MTAKLVNQYSTVSLSQALIDEILASLKTIHGWGSMEIFVQDNIVTQITVRNIRKTTEKSHTYGKRY